MDDAITSGELRLGAHFARPATPARGPGVVLCHGFPRGPRGAAASAVTFPELADRIARQVGWTALVFNLRGTGSSEGDFSARGWFDDIRAAVDVLIADTTGVWLVGVAEGGTFALVAAADDPRVRGVGTISAPRSLGDARDANRLRSFARNAGMIRSENFPSDVGAWAREAAAVDAVREASRVAPRPVMVMHGADDATVPVDEARAIAAAVGPSAELHVLGAAGDRLRHDPRAIATLLGWLEQQPVSLLQPAGTPPRDDRPTPPT